MAETTTILNRVNRAINFIEQSNTNPHWLGLGGSTTEWLDNNNPSMLSPTTLTIPELTGCIYVHNISLVSEDQEGDIFTDYARYKAYDITTSKNILIDKLATKVYCSAFIDSRIVPVGIRYRVLGLINNLQVSNYTPTESMYEFIPEEYINSYDLQYIITIPTKRVNANILELVQLILEF